MASGRTTPQTHLLTYRDTLGITAMQGRGFYYPADAAVGDNGRIYVVSRSLEGYAPGTRVTICSLDHEYFGVFSSYGQGDGQFVWPTGIALDSLGHIYVCDEYTNRISVFNPAGEFLARWGAHGLGPGQLNGPSGLAFDRDDNLYVVDHNNNRVQKFTKDGSCLLSFGSEGSGNGEFNLPWGLTVAPNGDVYVADWRNDRIQRFSEDGGFVAKYGAPGRGDGRLHRPASVAVDGDGYIYVADWGNERVQVLDPDGGFVTKLRGQATLSKWAEEFLSSNVEEAEPRSRSNLEPDIEFFVDDPHEESSHIEKYFWAPVSVKLDGAGRLYVTESNRHRMQVYERGFS